MIKSKKVPEHFSHALSTLFPPPLRIQMDLPVREKFFGFGQQQVFVNTTNYLFYSSFDEGKVY